MKTPKAVATRSHEARFRESIRIGFFSPSYFPEITFKLWNWALHTYNGDKHTVEKEGKHEDNEEYEWNWSIGTTTNFKAVRESSNPLCLQYKIDKPHSLRNMIYTGRIEIVPILLAGRLSWRRRHRRRKSLSCYLRRCNFPWFRCYIRFLGCVDYFLNQGCDGWSNVIVSLRLRVDEGLIGTRRVIVDRWIHRWFSFSCFVTHFLFIFGSFWKNKSMILLNFLKAVWTGA